MLKQSFLSKLNYFLTPNIAVWKSGYCNNEMHFHRNLKFKEYNFNKFINKLSNYFLEDAFCILQAHKRCAGQVQSI